jgi:hypothetical protein
MNSAFSFRSTMRKPPLGSSRVLPLRSFNSSRRLWGAIARELLMRRRIPTRSRHLCRRNLRHRSFSIQTSRNQDRHNPQCQPRSATHGARGGWAVTGLRLGGRYKNPLTSLGLTNHAGQSERTPANTYALRCFPQAWRVAVNCVAFAAAIFASSLFEPGNTPVKFIKRVPSIVSTMKKDRVPHGCLRQPNGGYF